MYKFDTIGTKQGTKQGTTNDNGSHIGCADITCFCRLGRILCYCCVNIIVGCLNGGGQVRPSESEASKELLDRVEAIYSAVK